MPIVTHGKIVLIFSSLLNWCDSVLFIGVSDCSEICYKDPVLKDRQWSAYIDRSPGAASYSEECFHACVAGCGYKFEVESEEVDKVKPKRPPPPPPKPQPPPRAKRPMQPPTEDIPETSA
ncbi:Defensin-like protein [Hirschfeldia incana]|nr:Defensin-like protein [Hirschfeldia incana]